MSKASLVTVLAEDPNQQWFVYHYLLKRGYRKHEIRRLPVPGSRGGAGEQWSRQRYTDELQAYRRRASTVASALVVVVDADVGSVENRLQQLDRALVVAHVEARGKSERVACLVPRRNMETWILCLSGEKVDETTPYKKGAGVNELIKPAAHQFFEWSRPNAQIPAHCVRSIEAAIPEIQRID